MKADLDFGKMMDKLSEREKAFIFNLLENDPLKDVYRKILWVYLLIACIFLLWPFHFAFPVRNSTHWLPDSNGIEFKGQGQVISGGPVFPLYRDLRAGAGITLEVWAASNRMDQSGPARIVSYSRSTALRNFTLGQLQDALVMRLRTVLTGLNGTPPMVIPHVFDTKRPRHIMITYDFSEERIFLNGKIREKRKIPGGDFSNWDPACYLVFGNEVTGDRPWYGKLFGVAIYRRPLSVAEVRQNYQAGWSPQPGHLRKQVKAGLVVRYRFNEKTGAEVRYSPGSAIPLNLSIPKWVQGPKHCFMCLSYSQFTNSSDVILNILAFIPIGFFLCGVMKRRNRSSLIVLVSGTLFTLAIESIQYFLPARTSSFADVMDNCVGLVLGIVAFKIYDSYLQVRYRRLCGLQAGKEAFQTMDRSG